MLSKNMNFAPKKGYQKISHFFLTVFISTLPFSSVKVIGGLTPTQIAMIMLGIFLIFRFINSNLRNLASGFEKSILIYLVVACISSIFSNTPSSSFFVLTKTLAYFIFYLLLLNFFNTSSKDEIRKNIFEGVFWGSIVFLFVFTYFSETPISSWLNLNTLNYNKFFYVSFKNLNIYFGNSLDNDFDGSLISRNSIGEVFVLFTIYCSFGKYNIFKKRIIQVISVFFVFCTFSQRSILSIVFTFIFYSLTTKSKSKIIILMKIFISICIFYLLYVINQLELGYFDVDDGDRINQYKIVLQSSNIIFGHGYGTKLSTVTYEAYVHNFILSSYYMMGFLGLLFGLAIFINLTKNLFISLIDRNALSFGLMLIPLFSLSVGATTEGIFSLAGWLAIAFYKSLRDTSNIRLS